ncbi:MAG: diguanylate cyclase [Gammaproteobacteria bacterium]|nr:diguanylate cyclase [Gammaproteobacteria bacterium]
MLQAIDVGVVVLDRDYRVKAWNMWMQNHSGLASSKILGQPLAQFFPDLGSERFRAKAESVFLLNNQAFLIWQQQPYLFHFRNDRPITGNSEFMFQDVTLVPITGLSGQVEQLAILVYDVTDSAEAQAAFAEANARLENLSRTDRLTGLFNRGHWEECLQQEFARYQRTKQTSCLVIFDIDHFKKVNDTYGHPAGDAVIRQVSAMLAKAQRKTDVTGRYGGEEFTAILVGTDAAGAAYFAERLRAQVEAVTVTHEGRDIRFTISLGIAEIGPKLPTYKAWLERADQGLYKAKQGGRNQYVVMPAP